MPRACRGSILRTNKVRQIPAFVRQTAAFRLQIGLIYVPMPSLKVKHPFFTWSDEQLMLPGFSSGGEARTGSAWKAPGRSPIRPQKVHQ